MGIPYLNSFVEKKVPQCLFDIDIIKEIENWCRQNSGQPTIVFDFPALTYAIEEDPFDNFFSRRSLSTFKQVEQFFNMLRENDVKLVFFEDGPMQPDKFERVTNRQNTRLENILTILDEMYKNNSVKELLSKYKIGTNSRLNIGIRKIAKKFGGEFKTSYHNECDKEIVAYAIKANAMAVFSDDTDFLIFKGKWQYWSTRHLNLQTMTTKCYNKTILQQYLKLTEDEMPLLASLAGNDLISRNILERFHRYLGRNGSYNFQNISQFIINDLRKRESYGPENIALRVFGRIKELPECTELVRKSLNSYNIDLILEDNDTEFMRRMRTVRNDCYKCLLNMTGSLGLSYFDLRTPQFGKSKATLLKLKRRQFGIILQHKNDKTLTRNIYCFNKGQYVSETLEPDYPSFDVPDLEDLYDGEKMLELKLIKLKLIAWVLSDRLDFNAIQNIDNKYFCACLVLYYMVENSFITVREADIFLHTIETVFKMFSSDIDIPYFERVNPRVFQLVYLYSYIYLKIKSACENCGLFNMEADHLDGLYFHHAYRKMNNLNANQPLNVHLAHLRLYEGL